MANTHMDQVLALRNWWTPTKNEHFIGVFCGTPYLDRHFLGEILLVHRPLYPNSSFELIVGF